MRRNLVGRSAGKSRRSRGTIASAPLRIGRCQHIAIVEIRQVEGGSEGLVSRHDGIGKMAVHDRAGPLQHAGLDVGAVGQETAHPFDMDVGTPVRHIQVAVDETHQQVTKSGRTKDIVVEQAYDQNFPTLWLMF